ncbi:MAG: cytochrome P450 [Acidobacteriota bacterium]
MPPTNSPKDAGATAPVGTSPENLSERFDLSNLGRPDLYSLYAEVLKEAPVYWSPSLAGWFVSKHAYVVESFRDSRLSANRLAPVFKAMPEAQRRALDPLASAMGRWTLVMDPPDHTRMRKLIVKAFTPRLIDGLEPKIRPIVDRLLEAPADDGRMDVIRDLAYPLPATVIALMLGVPLADIDILKKWSDDLADFLGLAKFERDKVLATQNTIIAMGDYFRDLIAEHRRRDRGDLLSQLIAAREAGEVLDDDELVATIIMLVFAGHETTTNLIANAVLTLDRHPHDRRRAVDDPSLLPAVVEEVLRFESPVQRLSRMAAEDFTLGGQHIERGQRLFLLTGAANRDPDAFLEPDRFRLDRRDPGRHLGFGWGRHFCIGAALGRLEARLALEALFARAPGLRVEGEPEWMRSSALRALHRLPVRF